MAKTILPSGSYTYSPASQQVDFSNFTSITGAVFDFTRLMAIIDVTQGQIIYSTAGHPSNLNGSYSAPILTLAFDTTPFPGGDLQIIYDLASSPSATYDGTGTQPILSTTDPITGREGLDINLLNSSFGGQLGWPLPSSTTSGYNDALSVGFINGGNLVAPNMDPMTNNLIVDINSFPSTGPSLPVTITGPSPLSTSFDYWQGSPVSYSSPPPFQLTSTAGGAAAYNSGATDAYTLRTASNSYTSSGNSLDYGAGQVTSNTPRTVAPDYSVSGPSAVYSAGNNILTGGSSAFNADGYRFASIQVISTGTTGSYIFEGSNDNAAFFNIPVYNSLNPTSLPILGAITPIVGSVMYSVPISCRWLQVRVVSSLGGNAKTYSRFSQTVPPLLYNLGASQYNPASNPSTDVLNVPMVASKYNQVEIDFNTAPSASVLTTTTTGGGTITQSNGHSLFTTGTATTASAKAVTVASITYRPANEIYSYFTASFTTPTSGSSYQRIGMYDTNNGFFIGYSGTNFGVTKRTAAVDTFTIRTAWNGDPLDGSSASKFTRNGIPEAINFTVSNLFRIRYAWLGSGNILFDVFSPDGSWVNFHNIKQPNSSLNPSLTVPNVPITLDVAKASADATSLVMATACWAGGTTSPYAPITATLTDNTLATVGRSVITGVTTGGGGGYVNVKVNPSGALVGDFSNSTGLGISSSVLPTGASTSALQTTGNTSLSSIDTKVPALVAGRVPVDGSGVTQPVSATTLPLPTGAATETTLLAINTKTPALGAALTSASTPVNIAYDQVVNTGPNGQTTFGTINALNGFTVVNVGGYTACAIDIRGTFTATVSFQGTLDGANWIALQAIPYGSAQNVNLVTSTASAGAWLVQCAGCTQVRAIATAYTSGTITTVLRATPATSWAYSAPVGSTNAIAVASGTLTTVSTVTTCSTVTTVGSVTSVASSNLAAPALVTDVASAAITTTTTAGPFTPTAGTAYAVVIPVTAVSGTSPTLQVSVEEADDSGTNFFTVYQFPTITAVGTYRSPPLLLRGNRVRYVQTVTGTTPSFTRALTRFQRSDSISPYAQIQTTTQNLNATGATGALYVEGMKNFAICARVTAQTTAATIALEFSSDGTNWLTTSTTLTTIVGSVSNKIQNELWKFARLNVTAAGTGITLGDLYLKAIG